MTRIKKGIAPPPTPAPPFMVQAHRKGQFTDWVSDAVLHTLPAALAAARTLHHKWKRKVRVIDQEEYVWLRLPEGSAKGRQ